MVASFPSLFAPRRSSWSSRRFRPHLEGLGDRICPSTTDPILPPAEMAPSTTEQTLTLEPGTPEYDAYMAAFAAMDTTGTTPTETTPSEPGSTTQQAAPVLTLQIEMLQGRFVRLFGTVIADDPASCWVFFSGAYSGSTNPDASGNFSIEVEADYLGQIDGVAFTGMGIPSNGAAVEATSSVPIIETFTGVQESGNYWTFSGTILDESPADGVVYFGGILSGYSAMVQADGTFTLCVELEEGAQGLATAMAMDAWWQMSEVAEFMVISA